MKYLLIIFSVVGLLSCQLKSNSAQLTNNEAIADSTIYEFLNSAFSEINNGNKPNIILDKTISDNCFRDLKFIFKDKANVFSAEDIQFIYKQIATSNLFKPNQKYLNSIRVLPADSLDILDKNDSKSFWDNFHEKYGWGYLNISKPLFSKDKLTVVINIEHSCGSLCGSGLYCIYRKEKGKWKLFESITTWVS